MSNTEELKNYLIDVSDGFLLNPDNNGKTIMLSGAWGVGKTHFWQNVIEPKLSDKLKEDDKACVYVSLYGKDSFESLKKEVFISASLDKNKDELLSKEVSTFGFEVLSSIANSGFKTGQFLGAMKGLFDWNKANKGIEKLKDGGIICFDDFERKSKHIDLNDLFGFIAQLAIDMNCKIVIILNSDVFKGEEANVFKNVKEKTVNKYFHFEPTAKELFYSVANDEKYDKLNDHKEEILKAIIETDELNARIYIQVLDNCLEWVDKGYELNLNILKPLVLISMFFAKYHYSFYIDNLESQDKVYEIYHAFNENIELAKNIRNIFPQYASGNAMTSDDIIHSLKEDVTKKKKDSNGHENAEIYYTSGHKLLEDNKYMLRDFYIYKYILKIDDEIDDELFNDINQFIKTGILSKQTKEVESSLPQEAVAEVKA